MEKLICDRCRVVYAGKDDIEEAKRYEKYWKELCKKDGDTARGISACPNVTCEGELLLTN